MLPKSYTQACERCLKLFLILREQVETNSPEMKTGISELEQLRVTFQTEILNSETGQQSVKTEIYRLLRLLDTDWLFWQSARDQIKAQARKQIISDRLNQLIQYCQLLTDSDNPK